MGRADERWLVLGSAADLGAARDALVLLARTRLLEVVVVGDDVPSWLGALAVRVRAVGRRFGGLTRAPLAAGQVGVVLRLRNPELARSVTDAQVVVALGRAARGFAAAPAVESPGGLEDRVADLVWAELDVRLDAALDTREGRALPMRTARQLVAALSEAGALGADSHRDVAAKVPQTVSRLVRAGALEDAGRLLVLARSVESRDPVGIAPVLDALALAAELRGGGSVDPDAVLAATTDSLAFAESVADDDERWLLATTAALDVHFDRRLHATTSRSPLVEDPARWAGPVAASRVVRAADSAARSVPAPPRGPISVAYLPGSFPRHATSVLDVLGAVQDLSLDVVQLPTGASGGFRPVPRVVAAVRDRVGAEALTGLMHLDPADAGRVAAADVVIADWADMGAVWASHAASPAARLIVRIHSVDVLGAAVHLIDWGRVTDLVLVAEHVRDVVRDLLGPRIAHLRIHVVPVLAPVVVVPDAPAKDPHLVALIGWAQQVKDPEFALDVIAALRRSDARWRLRLIGPPVPPATLERPGAEGIWARALTERVAAARHDGAVEVTGQVDDVPWRLADAGHVLNTSLREGCPTAVIEGVWAGCLPVVRDWPLFAARAAAATTLPRTLVVDSVDGAVTGLREHAELVGTERGDRELAGVRAAYRDRFDPERIAASWRSLVAGAGVGATSVR